MDLINCPRCRKLFHRLNNPICDTCMQEEEDLFQAVRKYLVENPDCTLEELARETGASIKKIMKYLQEGRIEVSRGMRGELKCEQCGRPILSGKYCDKCVIELTHSMDALFNNRSKILRNENKGPKMHTRAKSDQKPPGSK